jgi:hypothetical protein
MKIKGKFYLNVFFCRRGKIMERKEDAKIFQGEENCKFCQPRKVNNVSVAEERPRRNAEIKKLTLKLQGERKLFYRGWQ